ncbi:MAG: sodium:calcium antiporter [Pseudomonadota bacterium]|nr:sodium:calcium antiporter [Pseudomonadota bacterium]
MFFYISIIIGIILLSFGGDYLVKGSSGLARKLNISPMIIGIVIIGFGTSVPEIFVASNAVINNSSDIALGSVVGSNIANILLVFSFGLLIAKDNILKVVSIGDMFVMLAVTLLLSIFLIIGSIKTPLSFLMILLLPIYFYCSYSFFNKNIEIDEIDANDNYLKLLISIFVGFFLLFLGSDIFIKGLKDFAAYYNIPEAVLGLTLAAIGTSLPELAVTFASVKNKAEKVLLGNILGSNIINVLGALGISSLFGAIIVPEYFSFISLYYLIFSALWLYLLTRIQTKKIYLGSFGLALYVIYIISLY